MAILEPIIAETPPIQMDVTGTARVGGTRVTLDTIIGTWLDGATAESIVSSYDVLTLADVYAVVTYYLRHRGEVEVYLKRREEEAEEVRHRIETAFPPEDFRARLLARQRAEQQARC